MTIWISRELSLFNFERLDILLSWIRHPCDKLWPFEFLESFRCSIWSFSISEAPKSDFRVTSYSGLKLLRASVLNFKRLDMLRVSTRHPSKKLLSFEFATSICFQFRASRNITGINRHPNIKLLSFEIAQSLCSQFRESWYITGLNRTSE